MPGLAPQRNARRGALLAAGVFLWACSPGGDVPAATTPVHARLPTGDVYQSTALGFSIAKPPGWVFRPETSLPVDAERSDDRARLWALLVNPARTPVITLAAPGAGRSGPLARVRAVPIRAEDSPSAVEIQTKMAPEQFIDGTLNSPWRQQDLVVAEAPTPLQVSGHDAARIVLHYSLRDDDGETRAVEERIVHLRRGMLFFWIEMLSPVPVDPAVVESFDRILASFRVTP
jgi:hypothetical protein